ncbi:putative sorting nexin-33 [Apostichopus japonicus]|uniref:Putative sorting nexin-33 n=1 Tax=Stichopus japonicus TaxID=307972 RepID=A0A2G8LK48_STIJA|nr:putative sorting nexin-33 [Apostichopus japonicus]
MLFSIKGKFLSVKAVDIMGLYVRTSRSSAGRTKVLYDFEGEAGNGELTVYENDVVTIIRQNVGDGWWEAETDNGQRGLVPEAWMEIITAPQSVPATPNFDDEWDDEDEDDDWDDGDSVQQVKISLGGKGLMMT